MKIIIKFSKYVFYAIIAYIVYMFIFVVGDKDSNLTYDLWQKANATYCGGGDSTGWSGDDHDDGGGSSDGGSSDDSSGGSGGGNGGCGGF